MASNIQPGQKYGKLTVTGASAEKDAQGRTLYDCSCECGGSRLVPAYLLLSGRVTSCGCARKAAQKAIGGSKERYGWTPEDEAERVRKIYTQAAGVYQRGKFWVAQMKFGGRTYHILSTPDKEEAITARQEIVRLRMESGDDAAVEYLEQQKEARKAERRKLMKQYGGFPTREEMAEMKQKK